MKVIRFDSNNRGRSNEECWQNSATVRRHSRHREESTAFQTRLLERDWQYRWVSRFRLLSISDFPLRRKLVVLALSCFGLNDLESFLLRCSDLSVPTVGSQIRFEFCILVAKITSETNETWRGVCQYLLAYQRIVQRSSGFERWKLEQAKMKLTRFWQRSRRRRCREDHILQRR